MPQTHEVTREAVHPASTDLAAIDEAIGRIPPPNDPGLSAWHANYSQGQRVRLAHDLAVVRDVATPDAHVLECGSVPLILTAALADLDYSVTGCDIDPTRYEAAINELGLRVAQVDIETEPLPFESGSFDLVIFNELFEHLRINPIATLREVKRVLRSGGALTLSTPNLRSLRGILNLTVRNRGFSCAGSVYDEWSKVETLGHMGHVREYTTREVIEFLGAVGFKVDRLVYRGRHSSFRAERLALTPFRWLDPFVTYVARAG